MDREALRKEIGDFLRFKAPEKAVDFEVKESQPESGYTRNLITYRGTEGDEIWAFLLIPEGTGPFPAVLLHHQNNDEWHLGKSEVCGVKGDPLQAFGPYLARKGIMVLAPDSICFEDRRQDLFGTEADHATDKLQHYREMTYRLLVGDFLMHKILDDAALSINLLYEHPLVDPDQIGTLGHGYGGTTVLFHAALDTRIRYACISGSAFTFKNKMIERATLEMAEVIPGFIKRFDTQDLVKCIAPRRILFVTATDDKNSKDADIIVKTAKETFSSLGAAERLEHRKFLGGKSLTAEEFEYIIEWISGCAKENYQVE